MNRRRVIFALIAIVVLVEVFVRDRYDRVLEVHLEVLSSMAQKMASLAESDGRPSPNDVTELIYPRDRARQFLEKYRDEGERPSYAAFRELVDGYEGLVMSLDEARSPAERWQAFSPQVAPLVAKIEAAVGRTRALLADEGS